MQLSDKNRKVIENLVEDEIKILEMCKPEPKKFKQIWRYEHHEDFLYGWMVGMIEGAVSVIFMTKMGTKPSIEEQFEIREIIETHGAKIRSLIFRS